MAKFCSQCGSQMPDQANVCTNCGTPLGAPVQPVQYQQQAQPQPAKSFNELTTGLADKFTSFFTIVAIIFIALGATAFLYYFIMAIVDAADFGEFRLFASGFAGAIASLAKYAFYAVVSVFCSKMLKK